MGGIGKTVLASALARDEDVRKRFSDGIFWLNLGQSSILVNRQLELAGDLGERENRAIIDVQDGRGYLSGLLADKACLIILDDVWDIEQIDAFDVLGSSCWMMITTRNAELLQEDIECNLDFLKDEDALKLLATRAGLKQDELPTEAKEVAKECGNLPLALAMVGAKVRGRPDRWEAILHHLKDADISKIKADFPGYPYPDLFRALEASVEDLKSKYKDRYFDLAVFPKNIQVPLAVLKTFWEPEGLDKFDVDDLIHLFTDRSLARKDRKGLILHDLQRDYLQKRAENLKALHNCLLNAYWKKCSDDWPSGPSDDYFFQYLPYHLSNAGRNEDLKRLLLDFNWIKAKLQATDVGSLISDYDHLHEKGELRLIQEAIRLSAHVLSRDPKQLQSQLYGRLTGHRSQHIQNLMEQILKVSSDPWLRPLMPSLIAPGGPLIRTLQGHTDWVSAVSVIPDGRKAVSGSSDKTLKVWDLETGQELRTLEGHTSWVSAVSVIPDGRKAVSGSYDNTLKVWDLETGQELRTLEGHTDKVTAVSVTPDGRKAVSGSHDKTLKVWDLETGQKLWILEGHTDKVTAVSVTPDGRKAVSGSDDNTLKVWDLETSQELWTLEGHTSWVTAVSVTPDGRKAVSGSSDKTLKVWDLETGQELRALEGHTSLVTAVSVTPDGRKAVSGSPDNMLKVWDLETGQELQTLEGHTGWVSGVSVTPDGRKAVSGSHDNTLKVWDLKTCQELRALEGHTSLVTAVSVTPDGRKAVSGSEDNTLKVWDLETGQELRTLEGHTSLVTAVSVTPDGRKAVSGSYDKTLKVWDLETGQELWTLEGHTSWISAVSVTPDGRKAVSGSYDNTLKVWDLETGNTIVMFTGEGPITEIAIEPNGLDIIAGETSGRMHFLKLENN